MGENLDGDVCGLHGIMVPDKAGVLSVLGGLEHQVHSILFAVFVRNLLPHLNPSCITLPVKHRGSYCKFVLLLACVVQVNQSAQYNSVAGHMRALVCKCCVEVSITLYCSVEVRHLLGYVPPLYYLFNSLMVLLVVLHVYWFAIICKIALDKVLEGKDVTDSREE